MKESYKFEWNENHNETQPEWVSTKEIKENSNLYEKKWIFG